MDDWESSKPRLCSKLVLFKTRLRNLKVLNCCYLSSVQTSMTWGFQMSYYSSSKGSKGSKTVTCWSLKSEKKSSERPTRVWPGVEFWIFFRSPTLTGHNFAASWAMMMKRDSFENLKSYWLALNLKNSIVPLLTSVRTIYYKNRALLILKWKPL